MVELVDTQDLGSCAFGCEGSSPSFGTVFIWLRANSKAASDPARSSRLVKQALLRCRNSNALHQTLLHSPDAAFSLPGAVSGLLVALELGILIGPRV